MVGAICQPTSHRGVPTTMNYVHLSQITRGKKIGRDIFPFLIRVCSVYRCKFKLIIIVWVLFVVVGDDKLLCIACLDADHSNALWARRNEIYNTDNLLRPHFNFEQSKLFFRSSSCNFLLLKRTHVFWGRNNHWAMHVNAYYTFCKVLCWKIVLSNTMQQSLTHHILKCSYPFQKHLNTREKVVKIGCVHAFRGAAKNGAGTAKWCQDNLRSSHQNHFFFSS